MNHLNKSQHRLKRSMVSVAVVAGLAVAGAPALMAAPAVGDDPTMPFQDQTLPFSVRAADLVSRLTMEEKAQQFFTGIFNAQAGSQSNAQAPAIPRLGIPSYNYWNEALHGVARRGVATEFPTGLGIAATWDRDLVFKMNEASSDEARAKTNDCLAGLDMTTPSGLNTWCEGLTYWSPTINLARDPRWGRADESYGEDPYIAGEIAGQFAQGLQGSRNKSLPDSVGGEDTYLKAISTPKHFIANNSEVNRHSGTSNLSDRSLHEYYTAQFGKAAGKEYGAKSFMTSYNAVNVNPNYTSRWGKPTIVPVVDDKGGTPVPANKYAVETIMRRMYGFDGFVTSDCGAVQDTWEVHPAGHSWTPEEIGRQVTEAEGDAYSLKAGTDVDCTVSWNNSTYPKGLPVAQDLGLATEQDWDVALTRAFTIRFQTGEFDDADKVPYKAAAYSATSGADQAVGSPKHLALAHQMSLEAPVLLKNEDNALPLSVSTGNDTVVLGYYSTHPIHGGYSPTTTSVPTATASDRIKNYVESRNGTYQVIDDAITPAVGVKPTVQRLEAWAANTTPPPTGAATAANPALGFMLAPDFKPDNQGWEIRSNFSGVPTFYARDTMDGKFEAENFQIPAGTDKLRLVLAGADVLDMLSDLDPLCVVNTGPTTGCPTIASFEVTIGTESNTYPINRQTYVNPANSAVSTAYMPMVIPLSDFPATTPGSTATVRFDFKVTLPGGGGQSGVYLDPTEEAAITAAENAIVYVGTREADSNEEVDRPVVALPRFQEQLINRVATLRSAQNPPKKTVVYIQAVGQVDVEGFKNNVDAIIWTTYNGQYQGNAAAELLFGQNVTLEDNRTMQANPSGHLTWTFYSDVDEQLGTTANGASMDYSLSRDEGSHCGRTYWYYQAGTAGCAAPSYVFGHGLSYSNFEYSNVGISASSASPNDTVTVTATVRNAGTIPGREVVQVYASSPQADGNIRPYRQVKGFAKTGQLAAGASENVSIELKVGDLWFWDTDAQKRVYDQGTWKILVGPSSDPTRGTELTLAVSGQRKAGVDVVSAIPDGVVLNTRTPGNVINANVGVTRHDQSFYDLSDVKVEYTSADPTVARVNAKGEVSPVGAGATLITVKATADGETGTTTFPVAVHDSRPTLGAQIWTSPIHVASNYPALPTKTAFNYMVEFPNQSVGLPKARTGVQLNSSSTLANADVESVEYLIAPMDLNEVGATITPEGVLTATKTGQVQVTVIYDADTKISRHALITVVANDAQATGNPAKLAPMISASAGLQQAWFTPESWAAYGKALAAAKALAADPNATQGQIDAAASALAAATAGLKPVANRLPGDVSGGEADAKAAAAAAAAAKAGLNAVVADADALVGQASKFTPASVQALQAAIAAAKAVAANPAATTAEIQAALAAVSKAVAGLAPAAAKAVKAGTVKVSGTAKVGKKLTAKVAKWTKGTAYSYKWYAGSKVIKNATGKTLKITKSLAGKKIKVRVTGTKKGLVSAIKTSKATKKVKK